MLTSPRSMNACDRSARTAEADRAKNRSTGFIAQTDTSRFTVSPENGSYAPTLATQRLGFPERVQANVSIADDPSSTR